GKPERLAVLVGQLDARDAAQREQACRGLIAAGPDAIPHLRAVANDPDRADAAVLARRCLAALEQNAAALSAAAARLMARRRSAGAAEALLDSLSTAEDETALDEMRQALATVAWSDGKPDPALVKALADASPLRRACAVDAICVSGRAEPRETLHTL